MLASLLLLLQAAQSPIAITATAEPGRVAVGEEVVLTVEARTTLTGPISAEITAPPGLDLIGRSERVDPAIQPAAGRVYRLELRLRARQVGTWRFGSAVLFVGGVPEIIPDVVVTVSGSGYSVTSAPSVRLIHLIQRAPPPRAVPGATLAVVVSAKQVYRGQQLDVLTAAWFPRSIRARLRRAPTLKPPVLDGVWSIQQRAVSGIVSSMTVGDETYDLFVSHQVVFPLSAGPLTIPPARVEYTVPASRRSASGERPVEAASDPVTVDVLDLPASGRPAGFRGPVAQDVRIGYRIDRLPARAGDPLPVSVNVSGSGNLAFWPPPGVDWPPGTRAYLDGIDDDSRSNDGVLGGLRTFRFLLLPDSAGSLALPALTYGYFDPDRQGYREATAGGLVIPVLEPDPSATRRDPVPLVAPRRDWPRLIDGFQPSRSTWWWLAAALPVLPLLAVAWWRRRRTAGTRRAPPRLGPIAALEQVILRLAPTAEPARPGAVAAELRRAGVERDLAEELARLREQVDEARFGPAGERTTPLGATTGALKRLTAPLRRRVGLLVLLAAAATVGSEAQTPTKTPDPTALYQQGAYGPAARAFRAAAEADPASWQRWYDLAAAEYLAGHDAAAAGALVRSRELAPRALEPRRLWGTLERGHEPLHEAAPKLPLSRSEGWLAVLALWWLAAIVLVVRPRPAWLRRTPLALALAALALILVAGRSGPDPVGFTRGQVALRVSPHGLAPERGGLPALTRVWIERRDGDWLLVRDHLANRGWIAASAVAPVRGLD